MRIEQFLPLGRVPDQQTDESPHFRREVMAMRIATINPETGCDLLSAPPVKVGAATAA